VFHSVVLGAHIAAGTAGLVIGPIAMIAPKRRGRHTRAGLAYQVVVALLTATALVLVAFAPGRLWGFVLIAVGDRVRCGRRLDRPSVAGGRAGCRVMSGLMAGSYVSFVTALLVVNWPSSRDQRRYDQRPAGSSQRAGPVDNQQGGHERHVRAGHQPDMTRQPARPPATLDDPAGDRSALGRHRDQNESPQPTGSEGHRTNAVAVEGRHDLVGEASPVMAPVAAWARSSRSGRSRASSTCGDVRTQYDGVEHGEPYLHCGRSSLDVPQWNVKVRETTMRTQRDSWVAARLSPRGPTSRVGIWCGPHSVRSVTSGR